MTTITPMDELLSVDTLTGMIRHYADQAEERACTQLFQSNAKRLTPAGSTASWDEVEFNRHFAPVTGVDSPHTQARRLLSDERLCGSRLSRHRRRGTDGRLPAANDHRARARAAGM